MHQLLIDPTHSHEAITRTARMILDTIIRHRRSPESDPACEAIACPACSDVHLPKIQSAVEAYLPVPFVLPAFPGKSPNPEKVLGVLPDLAEELALKFLQKLSEEVKAFYPPGIKIIICSDGRVFSDVVGIKEEHISAYQVELERMIQRFSLSALSTFNLDDVYPGWNFLEMRRTLMNKFGKSLEELKYQVSEDVGAHRMYCGITRFLFEDALHSGQVLSRSAIQREARQRAYEVIRRSNAWSELIAQQFPEAVRLSIHPQTCGSSKLGIRLIKNESWMTPWHGVAVKSSAGFVLMKKSEALSLGAEVVVSPNGQASFFTLESV